VTPLEQRVSTYERKYGGFSRIRDKGGGESSRRKEGAENVAISGQTLGQVKQSESGAERKPHEGNGREIAEGYKPRRRKEKKR